MQRVPAAGRPAGHHGDHDLRHGADQPLHLEDVQPAPGGLDPRRVHRVGRLAGRRTGSRCGPGSAGRRRSRTPSRRPSRRRPVAGQQHAADVRRHPRVVEHPVELVDRVRPEGVAHLRPVEGDAHRAATRPGDDRPVVGDVGEVEALDRSPGRGVEDLGDHIGEDRGMGQVRVWAIPMRTRFRGIDVREGVLLRGAGRLGRVVARSGTTTTRSACRGWPPRREAARRGLARAGTRVGAGERDGARGRSGPRDASGRWRRRRLPHRQGQGRRARPDRGRRPGARRGGPRRARPGRRGAGRRQRRLGRRHRGADDRGARPGRRRAGVRRAAVPHGRGAGGGTPAGRRAGSPPTSRSAGPTTRCGWPRRRPRTSRCSRCSRWAGCAACLRVAEQIGLPVRRVVGAGDLGRARGRAGAGRRAARAALRLRAGHPARC